MHTITNSLVQKARQRLNKTPKTVKSTPVVFYSVHIEFLKQTIHTIQTELTEYQRFSFWTVLLLIKDFFIGSTLTQERMSLAKSYSSSLEEQTKQIGSINDTETLKQFSQRVITLHGNSVKANQQLEHTSQASGRLTKKLDTITQEIKKISNRSRFFPNYTIPERADAPVLENCDSSHTP